MKSQNPSHVMSLAADEEKFEFYIDMQRTMLNQALRYHATVYPHRANLNLNLLSNVYGYLRENLGLVIPQDHLVAMFILYPIDASTIVDVSTTETRDSLLDMISQYYVNSYWPEVDDGVDDEDWEDVLRKALLYMHAK